MKKIINFFALIIGLYGIIACSIAYIVIRLLSIPLLPFTNTNEFHLKENEKWSVVKKILDICDRISDKL